MVATFNTTARIFLPVVMACLAYDHQVHLSRTKTGNPPLKVAVSPGENRGV